MPLFAWNHKYSVGIASIDTEHKVLLDLMNLLFDSLSQGKADEALESIVEGLIEYAKKHFSREENFFNKIDYPYSQEHKKEHDAFVSRLAEFKQKLSQGNLSFSVELVTMLRDWLVEHILGSDMKFAPYFKENGIE